MPQFDRITFDPQIMGGRACIRGMRIPVSLIVGQIAHGASKEEILQGYPGLEPADIEQAIQYAAWLTREQVFTEPMSSATPQVRGAQHPTESQPLGGKA